MQGPGLLRTHDSSIASSQFAEVLNVVKRNGRCAHVLWLNDQFYGAQQDALYCLYDLERSAEHDDSVLWATCGELLVRLWPTVCGGADASAEQVRLLEQSNRIAIETELNGKSEKQKTTI